MTLALVYDPRGHTFDSWASLMVEAYAAQQLEIPNEKTDWKLWGQGLLAIDIFTNEAIPNPALFDDWQLWAKSLFNALNQRV